MDGAVEIAYNTSQNYGGGISASEGALVTVESGTIHDNTALGQGGGVWVRGGSVFAMNGGSLYGNHAEIGGGLYNDVESTARITGNAFIGSPGPNTADKYALGFTTKVCFMSVGTAIFLTAFISPSRWRPFASRDRWHQVQSFSWTIPATSPPIQRESPL